jgi:hypothetical protein
MTGIRLARVRFPVRQLFCPTSGATEDSGHFEGGRARHRSTIWKTKPMRRLARPARGKPNSRVTSRQIAHSGQICEKLEPEADEGSKKSALGLLLGASFRKSVAFQTNSERGF